MKKKVFLTIAMLIVVVLSIAGMVGCKEEEIFGTIPTWNQVKSFDNLAIIFAEDGIYPTSMINVKNLQVGVTEPKNLKGKEGIIEYMEQLEYASWSYCIDGVMADVKIDKVKYSLDIKDKVEGEDYTVINGTPVFRTVSKEGVVLKFDIAKYGYSLKVNYPKINDISEEVKLKHMLGMEEYVATFVKK